LASSSQSALISGNRVVDNAISTFFRMPSVGGLRGITADIAVVYYAGHGIEVNGTNHLIPSMQSLRAMWKMKTRRGACEEVGRLLNPTSHAKGGMECLFTTAGFTGHGATHGRQGKPVAMPARAGCPTVMVPS